MIVKVGSRMEIEYSAIIIYESSKKNLNYLHSDDFAKQISPLIKKTYQHAKKKLKELKDEKSMAFEFSWGYVLIRLYHYTGKCDEKNDLFCQFKNKILLDFTFRTEPDEPTLQNVRRMCKFIREFFILSNGMYSCFQFDLDKKDYHPTGDDLKNGHICLWVYQNLFSKELHSRIPTNFFPSNEKFQINHLTNDVIEYITKVENEHGAELIISNNEFLDKRFAENRKKRELPSNTIERKIERIVKEVKSSSGDGYDELRQLGIEKERLCVIASEIAEYKMNRYKKGGGYGIGDLFDATNIYTQLKNKIGAIEAIKMFIAEFEETGNENMLASIVETLQEIPIDKEYLKKNAPDVLKQITKLNIIID